MVLGRLVSIPGFILIDMLWYEVLHLEWPRNTLVLDDIARLTTWLLITASSVILAVHRRKRRSGPADNQVTSQ